MRERGAREDSFTVYPILFKINFNLTEVTMRVLVSLLVVFVFLSGCASTKSFQLDVPTNAGTTQSTVNALKCAAQQAGWNVTFADDNSVSAQKTVGADNVPLTLNLRVEPGNPTKVLMTTHEPRGIQGSTLYQRPVIEALKNCGAPNVQWVPVK